MRKVAFLVEGQGEAIFIRSLLLIVFHYQDIKIKCLDLYGDDLRPSLNNHDFNPPNYNCYVLIVNVGNDEKVLSFIVEREKQFLSDGGYDKIFAIRDMYSSAYRNLSTSVDNGVNNQFIRKHKQIIEAMDNPTKVILCFAIMEFESWLLSMSTILIRIDSSLTNENIRQNLNFDLFQIDPETHFYHPSKDLNDILNLVGKTYTKSASDVYSLVSLISDVDIQLLLDRGICNSFKRLYDSIDCMYEKSVQEEHVCIMRSYCLM